MSDPAVSRAELELRAAGRGGGDSFRTPQLVLCPVVRGVFQLPILPPSFLWEALLWREVGLRLVWSQLGAGAGSDPVCPSVGWPEAQGSDALCFPWHLPLKSPAALQGARRLFHGARGTRRGSRERGRRVGTRATPGPAHSSSVHGQVPCRRARPPRRRARPPRRPVRPPRRPAHPPRRRARPPRRRARPGCDLRCPVVLHSVTVFSMLCVKRGDTPEPSSGTLVGQRPSGPSVCPNVLLVSLGGVACSLRGDGADFCKLRC